MMLTVGVIGGGLIAREHLEAIQTMNDLHSVALAEIDSSKRDALAGEYGLNGYTDYKQMIQETTPDIVIITLPHHLHKEAALFSAQKGCHLLLEKPMALNSEECEEIMKAAAEHKVQLLVGHIQHYFRENRMAKRVIQELELGDLVFINETRHLNYFTDDRPAWFLDPACSGGGIIMNIGAHCIDKVQWVVDELFTKVTSNLSYRFPGIEGAGLLHLETDSGIPVSISISGYTPVPRHVTEFVFTKGMMKVEVGKGVWVSKDGRYEQVYVSNQNQPFQDQLIELIDGITGKAPIENTGEYGKSIVQVIEAIYQSNQEAKTIRLSHSLHRKEGLV
ncbi:Gfo/Idh/MocA family oxidoreductase [Halobacillus litoralis]|uniref:Gfo/Idh/MocA family protein n=1 Tax=Halobacillus litoralis TaxID=45668 RepID=UPI00273DC77F|nr:Gfo/Idh/MocA family oxidoreductase [Halobacillus litoralis]WLR49097.1 Gfo/Idh/MocA family oxidoreductase [Halobacillus litoralis]